MGLEDKFMVAADFEHRYSALSANEITKNIEIDYINPAKERDIRYAVINGDTQGTHAWTDSSQGLFYEDLSEEQLKALEDAVIHQMNILKPFANSGMKTFVVAGNHDSYFATCVATDILNEEGYKNIVNTFDNPYDAETNTLFVPGAQTHEVDEEVSHLSGPIAYKFVNNSKTNKYVFVEDKKFHVNLEYISKTFGDKINSDTIAFSHEPVKGDGENYPDHLGGIRVLPNYGFVPVHGSIYFDLAKYTLKKLGETDNTIEKKSGNEQSIAIKKYLKANKDWINQVVPLIIKENPNSILEFLQQNINVTEDQLKELTFNSQETETMVKIFESIYSSHVSEETGVPFVSGGNAGSPILGKFFKKLGINYSIAGHLSFAGGKLGVNNKGEKIPTNKSSKSLSAIIGSADSRQGAIVERSPDGIYFTPIKNGEPVIFDEEPEKAKLEEKPKAKTTKSKSKPESKAKSK